MEADVGIDPRSHEIVTGVETKIQELNWLHYPGTLKVFS